MASKTQKSANIPRMSSNGPDVRAQRLPKALQKPKRISPRPTHFLSLPLGHHPALRDRIREFHEKIFPPGDTAAIEGLDRSILVDPRRLHLTIGVMALSTENPSTSGSNMSPGQTVSDAIALLQSLGPEIDSIAPEPVPLTLDKMGVLKTQRQQAGVLYLGPNDEVNEDTAKITRIFDLVGQRFRQEGFIEEAARPAVLHCTLINASHRKPRRIPLTFSYREIFDHASVDADSSETPPAQSSPLLNKFVRVDFGTWTVSEIQLCKMGSHGPDNEYISLASVPVGSSVLLSGMSS
ncbi:kinase A anchor protein [Mycena haematopus]|nr:kinase A anchor protein [Mycena haematopus]